MSRKADRSALQLTEDASWDEFIFTAVYAANGQRQSAELLNNTRKTTERIKRWAWVGDERFMITHSISSTKQSPLDCDWLVEFMQPRNGAKADQRVEESQTAHTFSTQTGNRLEKGSYVTQILLLYIYSNLICFLLKLELNGDKTPLRYYLCREEGTVDFFKTLNRRKTFSLLEFIPLIMPCKRLSNNIGWIMV